VNHLSPATLPARLLFLLTLTLAAPAARAEIAATVVYAFGDAIAADAAGHERRLSRGDGVQPGDILTTRAGRMQLRFTDGGYLGLQPDSRVRIDAYGYRVEAPQQDRSLLEFLKGGVRFVTGVIGARSRDRYRINSAVATIGVRGSGGRAVLCLDGGCPDREDGLYLTGNQDVLTVSNERGSEDVRPGQSFHVQCMTCPLVRMDVIPLAYAEIESEPPAELVLETGEQRAPDATPADGGLLPVAMGELVLPAAPPSGPPARVTVPLANGPGPAAVVAHGTLPASFLGGLLGGALTFDSAGALISYVDSTIPSNTFTGPGVLESDADGIMAWGLWNAGTATGGYASTIGSSIGALNYVVALSGSNTPGPLLSALNQSYVAFASTSPIAVSGGAIVQRGTPNSVTGTLDVNFAASTVSYSLAFPLAGQTFSLVGNARPHGAGAFLGNAGPGSTITSTGSACASTCTGSVPFGDAIQGFVTGPMAERAGATYGFNSGLGKVSGSVVFQAIPQ